MSHEVLHTTAVLPIIKSHSKPFNVLWFNLPFFDPEGGFQKATLVVVLLVVVISSIKTPKAF